MPRFLEGVADLQKEWTCKRYTDEQTTAHAAMNGQSENWQCNNTEWKNKNRLCTCVFLETIFAFSGKLSRRRSSSNRETCWGQWYLLESRKKSENSCSCKSATLLVRFTCTNVLKMCGRGFGWGNGRGMGVAWWDVIGYHTIYP